VRPSHLILERWEDNNRRKSCGGVVLVLKNKDPSKPKKIVQIDPCIHGIDHPAANGNFLKYSCRKLQVLIIDEAAMEYYETLP
jgi:hypothetical protein